MTFFAKKILFLGRTRRAEVESRYVALLEEPDGDRRTYDELRHALRESEMRFAAAVRATGEMVWDWDLTTDIVWHNHGYQTVLGNPPDDGYAALQKWQAQLHPEDRERVLSHLEEVRAGTDETWRDRYRLRRPDGEYLEIDDSGVIIRDEAGRAVRMIGTLRDVTEVVEAQRERDQAAEYADKILDSLPGTFYHVDADLRMLRWNRNFTAAYGYTDQQVADLQPLTNFPEYERGRVRDAIEQVFREGEGAVEADVLSQDGTLRHMLLTGRRMEFRGRPTFVGVGSDITEHKRLEEALRAEAARFRAQMESSIDGILLVDVDQRHVFQNRRMAEMWGIPEEMAASDVPYLQLEFQAAQTTDPEGWSRRVHWLDAHPDESAHEVLELLDGRTFEFFGVPVLGEDGHNYGRLWIHRDITAQRRAEQRDRYLATHDLLTGLPNRHLLGERVEEALVAARADGVQLAVLDLDLDRFKVINDGYGHPFGDRLLQGVTERLHGLLDDEATLARHGGDEFLVLLPRVEDAEAAHVVAQSLIDSLDDPFCVDGREVYLSASVGVSVFPQDGTTAVELIDNADVAMYHAKDAGRATFEKFQAPMAERTSRLLQMETQLRNATTFDQLSLAYQPKVDLRTGAITGCEALLRWDHPTMGRVSPVEFIPVAEDSGLIVPIGDWALRTACSQAKAWMDEGHPVGVAVNISARQFLRQDVVAWVTRTLDEIGLPPDRLELELTETLIAQDVEKVIVTLQRLRELGVTISIDDFGTGYSNLTYLKQFSVDALKIDRSFVSGMLTERGDSAIVHAAISLAHNLDLAVVAEGVETEAQRDFLRECDCDQMQGYLVSSPVPAAEFAALLAR